MRWGTGCGDQREVAVQVERVETLLAAVRDIVSSLGATSAQLEREVAQALRSTPAAPEVVTPPAGAAARAGAAALPCGPRGAARRCSRRWSTGP